MGLVSIGFFIIDMRQDTERDGKKLLNSFTHWKTGDTIFTFADGSTEMERLQQRLLPAGSPYHESNIRDCYLWVERCNVTQETDGEYWWTIQGDGIRLGHFRTRHNKEMALIESFNTHCKAALNQLPWR